MMTKTKKESPSMVINVEHLVKSYGDVKAVKDISFQIMSGETFGMLGPNGAGKTTTVEIIEGLRRADSGHISVLGMDVAKVPTKYWASSAVSTSIPGRWTMFLNCWR